MIQNAYQLAYRRAASPQLREGYWQEQARKLEWFAFPKTILDNTNSPFARWFPDGRINITYNMFDRFLPTHAEKRALIWVSNMVNQHREWTLRQAYEDTCRMCLLLRQQGVEKGDRIIIYMPMIPEAVFAAWASARLGAVHSIVFGGFSAKELSKRIKDCKPRVIVTTSFGLEPNRKINYVEIVQEALQIAEQNTKVLIYQRPGLAITCNENWKEFTIQSLDFKDVPCVETLSTDYLYILYTSGTTGCPKGVVRDHGGAAVHLSWMMNYVKNIHLGDTYFASSNIGWVLGHNITIYGAMLRGAATILYEGKPTTPNPGAMWEIIEKYKVKGFYISPAPLRTIKKEDEKGDWIKKYDLSSLKVFNIAGERCDIPTYEWIYDKLKILINDGYGQTENGFYMCSNYLNLYTFPSKAGSATKPCPGYVLEILDHNNKPVPQNTIGKICVKLPMPPSFTCTIYNNDAVFIEKYMTQTPGYYTTNDAGYFDSDGYLNITTRLDDIILVGGLLVSSSEIEEKLVSHSAIADAVVVAKIHDVLGQIPVGFVVIKNGQSKEGIQKQLVQLIHKQIGPIAAFHIVVVVEKLPITKSGKILRNVLRKIIEREPYEFPETIEDPSVLGAIEEAVKSYGSELDNKYTLKYRGDCDPLNKEFCQEELVAGPKERKETTKSDIN